MRKKISSTAPAPAGPRKRRTPAAPAHPVWQSRLLLYLESPDPNLLDKESLKLYHRILESGAEVQGPVPLPVRSPEGPAPGDTDPRIHRRRFVILSPTGTTVSILEKLSLSGSVSARVHVEDRDGEVGSGPPGAGTEP